MVSIKMKKTEDAMEGKVTFRIDYFLAATFALSLIEQNVFHMQTGPMTTVALMTATVMAMILTLTHLSITAAMLAFMDKLKVVQIFNENNIKASIDDLPKSWIPTWSLDSFWGLGWPITGCFLVGFNKLGCYMGAVTVISIVTRLVIGRMITKRK